MSDGTFYQCHLCRLIRAVVCVSMRIGNWTYPHGIYGHSAACTDGGGIRRGAVRHFIPGVEGKDYFAFLGEVIGTGIIGAIVSYPVMALLWGRTGLTWLFYVPSFIAGTLIGGSIAFLFLKQLQRMKLLTKFQQALGTQVYDKVKQAESSLKQ